MILPGILFSVWRREIRDGESADGEMGRWGDREIDAAITHAGHRAFIDAGWLHLRNHVAWHAAEHPVVRITG